MAKLLVVISLIFSIISAIEISSKIDLDSDEHCPESSSVSSSDPVIIVIKNEADVPKETRGFRSSGSRSFSGRNFNSQSPGNSIRTRNNYNPSSSQSKVIKNIYIVVSGKDVISSIPSTVDCKDNICETTMTSDTNDEDNEIDSVSVKVITKPKTRRVEDVPIIDGLRASGYEYHRDSSAFSPNNGRASSYPHFIDNNIMGKVPRRYPFGPQQTASFYPRNFGPRDESKTRNPWILGKNPVDDKIEPPLSQTDLVAQ